MKKFPLQTLPKKKVKVYEIQYPYIEINGLEAKSDGEWVTISTNNSFLSILSIKKNEIDDLIMLLKEIKKDLKK